MQYQGGKSRIARSLVNEISRRQVTDSVRTGSGDQRESKRGGFFDVWEPFCGGGAVTLALAKAGFRVHASDCHEDLILMWQALMRGETEPFADVTEAEYQVLKTAAPSARRGFVGFGASFGGGWFSGFGRHNYDAQPYHEAQRSLARLVGLNITFTLANYTTVPDDVLVYADPPYAGTKPYKGGPTFDHTAFWSWVRRRSGPTFVSELTCPYDDIEIVWRKAHKSQNASNSPTTKATSQIITREERLYYKPVGSLPAVPSTPTIVST